MRGLFDGSDSPGPSVDFPYHAALNLDAISGAKLVSEWLNRNMPPALVSHLAAVLQERTETGIVAQDQLRMVLEWWNRLADDGAVSHRVNVNKPNKEIVKAWRTFTKDVDLQDTLQDLDIVGEEIRRSPFCRAGWFRLEKLIGGGKNRDGTPIAVKLMDGGFREAGPVNSAVDAVREFCNGN